MHIKKIDGDWEKLCYSYELPWKTFESGPLKGKSQNRKSRIQIGEYTLTERSDGHKGWRLELENTGHRSNIQIHRAHSTMFIEGCILPMQTNNLATGKIKKGDPIIEQQSIAIMKKIKERYDHLKTDNRGKPSILIKATLPAKLDTGSAYA